MPENLEREAENLYNRLRPAQEAKGYYFNPDKALVLSILSGLLTMKKKQGYMTCPCRLCSGNRDKDKDIMCPCVYREADVLEYGTCFCGLYVSKKIWEQKTPTLSIPERRPVEKML